jgi:ABC-type glycerol-3-phosphate transport system substrate-binding protein
MMKKTILKTVALLIFIGGIMGFVGNKMGYFPINPLHLYQSAKTESLDTPVYVFQKQLDSLKKERETMAASKPAPPKEKWDMLNKAIPKLEKKISNLKELIQFNVNMLDKEMSQSRMRAFTSKSAIIQDDPCDTRRQRALDSLLKLYPNATREYDRYPLSSVFDSLELTPRNTDEELKKRKK